MNLYDNNRPQIFYRPAFTSGQQVIPRLQVWPINDASVEIAIMLPSIEENFQSHWKEKIVNIDDLPDLIREFQSDPEKFVQDHFGEDVRKIQVKPTTITKSNPSHEAGTKTTSIFSLLQPATNGE